MDLSSIRKLSAEARAPVTRMRMLTLWQPWATLYAMGIKGPETRGWRPNSWDHEEIVGIHAAASFPSHRHISDELHELCMDVFGCAYNHSLPLGKAVCTTRFTDFRPTLHWQPATDEERICGDWTPGRYAWLGADITELSEPITAKGAQGWWYASGDLLSAILAQAAALNALLAEDGQ